MTFSPPKQLSRVRGRKRYHVWLTQNALRLTNLCALQYDKYGNATGLAHFASPVTGKYRDRIVFSKKKKAQKVTKIRA